MAIKRLNNSSVILLQKKKKERRQHKRGLSQKSYENTPFSPPLAPPRLPPKGYICASCAPSWPLPCTSWFVWLRTSMHISTAHVLQRSNVSAIPAEVVSRRPVCAGNGLTSSAQVDFLRLCFFTTASERHFVFPVWHCPYWMLCPSLEPNAETA